MSLVAAALLAAGAAGATEPPSYPFDGLWTGTVGKMPVTVCFTRGQGSYYYDKYLIPISLRDGDAIGIWTEGFGDEAPDWSLTLSGSDRASGNWAQGRRVLPLELQRQEWTAREYGWGGACGSVEFLEPRTFEPEFSFEQRDLGGWRYRQVEWKPPAHLADNTYSGFEFAPDQPGDAAILQKLAADRPTGKSGDALFDCMSGGISSLGVDGYVSAGTEPVVANPNFISALTTTGNFCGGAHPNFWLDYRVFDRETGAEIDIPASWLSPKGFTLTEVDSLVITPELRDTVMGYYDNVEAECREAIGEQLYWNVGLVEDGLGFIPSVPHVLTVCGDDIHVPWGELEPFLSEEGRSALRKAKR
ncbi:MAG: hypothetical protein HKO08_00450 [Erythrobacter sp.]|nr:hypothetical protein [Erythrobacter sp.]